MLQNATPLRKSAPWPTNISDEHVSCTALATRYASLSNSCHRFWKCYKTLTFCSLFGKVQNPLRLPCKTTSELSKVVRACGAFSILTWKCAARCATTARTFFEMSTSKSGPTLRCFVHFDLEMCFAPQRRALFHHLNFQNWSETVRFLHFWLRKVLRTTTACIFSSSQLPNVLREWCVLQWRAIFHLSSGQMAPHPPL